MFHKLFALALLPVVAAWAPEKRMRAEFGAFLDGGDEMIEERSASNNWQVFLPTFNPLHRPHKMVAPLHPSHWFDGPRDFGAFLSGDEMLDQRSSPNSWSAPLPTFNPLHRVPHPQLLMATPDNQFFEPKSFGAFLDGDDMLEERSRPNSWSARLPTFNPLHRVALKLQAAHPPDWFEPRNDLPGYPDPHQKVPELQEAEDMEDNSVMKLFYNQKDKKLYSEKDVFGRDDVREKLEELEQDFEDEPMLDKPLDVHTKKIFFEARHKLPDHHYGSDL